VRLNNLRARDLAALEALIEAVPAVPPYDVALEPGDPAAPLVREAGFEPYATTARFARAIEGLPEAEPADGVRLLTYDNAMADRYEDAEFDALHDLAIYKAMGRPTGYNEGAGYGDFTVALRGDALIGFCFTQVPEGIIWWLGVVPDEPRAPPTAPTCWSRPRTPPRPARSSAPWASASAAPGNCCSGAERGARPGRAAALTG